MTRGRLVAIDGIEQSALRAAAREAVHEIGTAHAGVSYWDASGVFHELALVEGAASPRTLLLLYAADLAFRVRWEIAPALAEGRTVVAAPYVATATAFGRAVGLPAAWLANLLQFAPRHVEARIVEPDHASPGRASGFVRVAYERWAVHAGIDRDSFTREIAKHLRPRRARR
jgi:thymidylate kinase